MKSSHFCIKYKMNIRITVNQLAEMMHRILYVTYYIFNQKINSVICCNLW